jgi:hypothetical protein
VNKKKLARKLNKAFNKGREYERGLAVLTNFRANHEKLHAMFTDMAKRTGVEQEGTPTPKDAKQAVYDLLKTDFRGLPKVTVFDEVKGYSLAEFLERISSGKKPN